MHIHILVDALRDSILVTGLVVVMMLLLESINIESRGKLFPLIKKSKVGQVIFSALLGSIPGCVGGFAAVSMYSHRLLSFGALVAMMIASSGDEAFIMLAMIPEKALWIFAALFVIAVIVGLSIDYIHGLRCHKEDHDDCTDRCDVHDNYELHEGDKPVQSSERHWGVERVSMLGGVVVFLAALVLGFLSHEHGAEEGHEHAGHALEQVMGQACEHAHEGLNLLSEEWMYYLFAALALTVVIVLVKASDHFIREHLWDHIIKKHLFSIWAWTFGTLVLIGVLTHFIDLDELISGNEFWMILLAAAVGIIPESGPHLLFVTLFASGAAPLSVLMASCISQDGHASLPLLADSKKSFLKAKLINFAVAVAVGVAVMYLF